MGNASLCYSIHKVDCQPIPDSLLEGTTVIPDGKFFGLESVRLSKELSFGKIVLATPGYGYDMREYKGLVDFGALAGMLENREDLRKISETGATPKIEKMSDVWARWKGMDRGEVRKEAKKRWEDFRIRFWPRRILQRAGVV